MDCNVLQCVCPSLCPCCKTLNTLLPSQCPIKLCSLAQQCMNKYQHTKQASVSLAIQFLAGIRLPAPPSNPLCTVQLTSPSPSRAHTHRTVPAPANSASQHPSRAASTLIPPQGLTGPTPCGRHARVQTAACSCRTPPSTPLVMRYCLFLPYPSSQSTSSTVPSRSSGSASSAGRLMVLPGSTAARP